jgi:hypothetical protein
MRIDMFLLLAIRSREPDHAWFTEITDTKTMRKELALRASRVGYPMKSHVRYENISRLAFA